MSDRLRSRLIAFIAFSFCVRAIRFGAAQPPTVEFQAEPGRVLIAIGGEAVAAYVYRDEDITRPFFAHVRAPGPIQVTRNHPPIEGQDPTDHAALHPGIWLSFGDISGNDYWRLKARTVHDKFVVPPRGGPGEGSFTVRNRYLSAQGDRTICVETCRYTILVRPCGYLLLWESTFRSEKGEFSFGDQEEMGLGIRVATPISAAKGGCITDSEGRRNEKDVWGRQADWCDYGGIIGGRCAGVTIMPDPENFRPSWYHARDYGLLVANPFGQNAMTKGEKSKVVVHKGEEFHLGYAVFIYSAPADAAVDIHAAYQDYLKIRFSKAGP